MSERDVQGRVMELDPARWVDEHGDYLYRYALARLRQREAAEDLVQETFLAALRSRQRFTGKASERTWLVSILKHKIIDQLWRKQRELPVSSLAAADRWADELFDERGAWRQPPGRWLADPGAALEQAEFWTVFGRCLEKLPPRLARAFTLRQVEELNSHNVCKILDISATNLWTMLHRARLRLLRCLEVNWFGTKQ
jgi:RNA polymerase sigma-70 factor (ECF subfamily)